MSNSASQQPEVVNLSTKVDDLTARSEKLEKDLTEIISSIKELNKPAAKPKVYLLRITHHPPLTGS